MQHLVHVQTNASVDSSELLQSYWNADSSSLTMAGPSCHADSPLCYGVRSRPPLSVSRRQLHWAPLSNQLSSRVPLPLPDPPRFQVQKPLVWFRAKTDKGIVCLAGHLHSVTFVCSFVEVIIIVDYVPVNICITAIHHKFIGYFSDYIIIHTYTLTIFNTNLTHTHKKKKTKKKIRGSCKSQRKHSPVCAFRFFSIPRISFFISLMIFLIRRHETVEHR